MIYGGGMNMVPQGWVRTTVREVFTVVGGGTPSTSVPGYWTGNIPWITSADINGVRGIKPRKFVSEDGIRHSATNLVPAHAVIVVTRVGLGKVGLAGRPLAFSQDCQGLVSDPDLLNPEFAAYQLLQRVQVFKYTSRGTTISGVTKRQLLDLPFDLAPTAEQRRIVAAIEEQFSRIDAGVEALQRARRNLQRMRAAVLQAAVTGRLVPQDPDDEPAARFVAEATPVSGFYPLPSGWLWARVEALAEVQGGIQKQPKRRPRENAYPFLRVANVLRNELDLSEVHTIELFDGELDRYRLRRGDLLVVEGNGSPDQIGRSALWQGEIDPCVHQNHLIRVRPGRALNPNYLNFFWNAPSTAAAVQSVASSTSGLYTLSTAKVRAILVAVPPLSEQERIILEVNRQLSLIEAAQQVVDEASGRARNLRTTILGRAFAGGLVPQDPSDEPAGVLLHRIKAARAVPVHASASGRRARR